MARTMSMLKSRLLVALSLALTSAITFSALTTDYAYAVAAPPPSVWIDGSTPVGSTLSATIFSELVDPTFSYQWKRGSSPISGATLYDYVTVTADIGESISVDVTAEATGYEPVTVSSDAITPNGVFAVIGQPVISKVVAGAGPFLVGRYVAASTNVFSPAATSFSYEWRRNSVAITDATGAQYQLSDDDAGQEITVKVTGHLANYTDEYTISDPITPVGVFSVTPRPTVTGTTTFGSTLTANVTGWVPSSGVSYTYQWKRDGEDIPDATNSTYTLTAADIDATISVAFEGSKAGYTPVTTTSANTATIAAATFVTTTLPTITGTTTFGSTLTANVTGWVPSSGVSYTYQWKRDGEDIPDATNSTYVLTAEDTGTDISVDVTGTREGYTAETTTSVATSVSLMSFIASPSPVISGTARVGSELTSTIAAWDPVPDTLEYQWLCFGSEIPDATTSSLTLTPTEWGCLITLRVTGTRAGYNSIFRLSNLKGYIESTDFDVVGTPSISGTLAIDDVLTVDPGAWTPEPDSYRYQWRRGGARLPRRPRRPTPSRPRIWARISPFASLQPSLATTKRLPRRTQHQSRSWISRHRVCPRLMEQPTSIRR